MAVLSLTPGDIVRLNMPLAIRKVTDDTKTSYDVADEDGKEKSLNLFNSSTGIYIGPTRLKLHDKRSASGWIRHYYHKFMFGTHVVLIEHQYVDVYISAKELLEIDNESEKKC